MRQTWDDVGFCDHCDEETPHRYSSDGHERDSSGDLHECLVCHWQFSGLTGRYEPPSYEDRSKPIDDRIAFLRAIAEDDGNAPRLVYADWLEEHDEGRWAAIIRGTCKGRTIGTNDASWLRQEKTPAAWRLVSWDRGLVTHVMTDGQTLQMTGWAFLLHPVTSITLTFTESWPLMHEPAEYLFCLKQIVADFDGIPNLKRIVEVLPSVKLVQKQSAAGRLVERPIAGELAQYAMEAMELELEQGH